MEERFSDLNETLLGELHDMIQPYILRRIKADVLRLPPKVSYLITIIVWANKQIEIIVPISLTPIQKRVYRGILEKNADIIKAVMAQRKKKPKPVPAITGGEAIIEPTTTMGNGTKGPTEPAPNTTNADAVDASQTTENVTKNVITADTDIEMDGTTHDDNAVPANTNDPTEDKARTVDPTAFNGTQDIMEQETVVDSDHTDSARVEDTI